jgi:hypothetical protein
MDEHFGIISKLFIQKWNETERFSVFAQLQNMFFI